MLKFGAVFVVVLTAAVFSNAVNLGFTFDDVEAVIYNKDVNPVTPVKELFKDDFWGLDILHKGSHKSYRPATVLVYRAVRYVSECGLRGCDGAEMARFRQPENTTHPLAPTPTKIAKNYHALSIGLHAVNSLLVMVLPCLLFGWEDGYAVMGVAGALLFAAHPVHTENVDSTVGYADIQGTFFALLALMAYRFAVRTRGAFEWLWWALVSFALLFVSVFSKETGVTVALMFCVYEFLVARKQKGIITVIVHCVFVFGLLVALCLFRLYVAGGFSTHINFRFVEAPLSKLSGKEFAMSNGVVHAEYARLLLCPMSLSCDYSYNAIPLVTSIGDRRNLVTLLLYGAILVAGLWGLLTMNGRGKEPLFCLAWILCTFSMSSNILVPVGTVVGERLLYLPSIGLCWAFGHFVSKMHKKLRFAVAPLLFCFSVRTYLRNPDWKDNWALFGSAVKVQPNSVKTNVMLAELIHSTGNFDDALPYYQRGLEIYPEFKSAKLNVAAGMIMRSSTPFKEDEAIKMLYDALDDASSGEAAFSNLCEVHLRGYEAKEYTTDKLLKWVRVMETRASAADINDFCRNAAETSMSREDYNAARRFATLRMSYDPTPETIDYLVDLVIAHFPYDGETILYDVETAMRNIQFDSNERLVQHLAKLYELISEDTTPPRDRIWERVFEQLRQTCNANSSWSKSKILRECLHTE